MYVRVYFPWFSYITHLKIYLRNYSATMPTEWLCIYYCVYWSPFSAIIRIFLTIILARCVSLTYFDFLWLGDRFSGLLSPESNPTKYPISPWLRYSRSRCYCYNLQVGLGFLFSMFIIFRFSPRAIIQDSYLSLYFGEHSF